MTRSDGSNPARQTEERFADLVSALAHELRTPLTVIVGYAELMLIRDDEETRRTAPRAIHDAGRALLARLDELVHEATADDETPS